MHRHSSSIQTVLSVSELHRFSACALADFTAGREFHPALKIHMKLVTAYHRTLPLSTQAFYGKMNQVGEVGAVDGSVLGVVGWGILKLRMLPLADVSVTSPPMIWFL